MNIKARLKNHKAYSRYTITKKFFAVMGVKPIHIILPVFLSFIAASFDGVSLGLLIPLVKGVVMNNFDFIKDIAGLKYIVHIFSRFLFEGTTPNKNAFLFLITLVFLFILLKNIVGYANAVLSAYWHGKFKANMYKFVFERFLTFGKMFFDRTNQGYLLMVLNYSEHVMELLRIFEYSVNQLFTLVVYFTVMLMISWKLTIVTIVVFPLLHYSLKFIISRIHELARLINISTIESHRNVFNILSCIPLVKAYSKEEETKKFYNEVSEKLRKLDLKKTETERLIDPIQEIIVTMALLFMVSMVALLFAKGKPAEISIFVVFFYAARRSLPMFNILNAIKASFATAKPPLKELAKIFDDTDKFFVVEGAKDFEGLRSGIEFKKLNFSYIKEKQILKNLSFHVEKGRVTAIVGPSGAGKTTIISLLVRFYDCHPDSIIVDGFDVKEFTLKSLRKHMALVTQETLLLNDTLRNNMVFGLDRQVDDEELAQITKKARLYDFVKSLPDGFNTEVGDRGVKLSGGERQRVAIARALLKKSEILILDEATSSLDSSTEKLIQEAIDEAVKDRTAIVIAHRLSTIKHADKIVVIEDGAAVEQGSLKELLAREGKFHGYWEAQKFY